MITRFIRYPGGKILGFAASPKMQKRNYLKMAPDPYDLALLLGLCAVGVSIPSLAIYYSYKYFHNNYEIVRKDKKNGKVIDRNEKNVTEEYQSIKRPDRLK